MKKRNILFSLIIFSMVIFSLNPPKIRAHAANSMNLTYDYNTQTLSVTITHNVANPSTHYIQTVTIRVNGTIDTTEVYTDQPTTNTYVYQYNITAGHGATIQVTSVCNISGTLSRSLTVIDPTERPGSFTLSTDAGNPDNDGNFNLMWDNSFAAENYSVYSHTSLITVINQSLNQLSDQMGLSPFLVQGFNNGSYYIVVVAHNNNGDRLSNVEIVNVSITPSTGNGEPQTSIPGYNIIWILGFIGL
ncbi:MAG: hypothetical protein ACXACB_02795, partial [Promethearchaeota archaeon]